MKTEYQCAQELKKKLKELQGDDKDFEAVHSKADDLIAQFLTDIGYGSISDEYQKIGKWYA